MRRASRIVGSVLAAAAATMLLTACLKLDMDLNVSSDDTVSGTVILGIDKELLALSGQSADQFFQGQDLLPGVASGVSVADYDDGAFVGKQITLDGVSIDELNQGNGQRAGSDQITITREGDQFVVHGVLDLEFGGTAGTPQAQELAQQAKDSAEIRIRLSFPGAVTSSNGTIDGNSVTWTPVFGERTTLEATAGATGSWPALGLILGFLALVAFAGLVGAFFARSRNAAGADMTGVSRRIPVAEGTADAGRAIPPGEPSEVPTPPPLGEPSEVPTPPPPAPTVGESIVRDGGSTEPEPEAESE
jgi:hypothetical protein